MVGISMNAEHVVETESHNDDDGDSAYGDEIESVTSSITSSVRAHLWEHGRRYHSYQEGTYNFPNDEREQARYDLRHEMFLLAMGGHLYFAPLGEGVSRVLDLGTGTGIWAIQFGDEMPSAQVIGNDLSPIQPPWVPPNVSFEIDDIESPWQFSRPFDFIHGRYLLSAIADWPRLMRQAYKYTKPGGWVEFQDFQLKFYTQDDSAAANNKVIEFFGHLEEASHRIGRHPSPGQHLKGWIEEAGFENVREEIFRIPVAPWPKDPTLKRIGALNLIQFLDGLEAMSIKPFTKGLGWSVEAVQAFLVEVRQDAKKRGAHILHNLHVVYGQRPELL